jgi:hypothetical protein
MPKNDIKWLTLVISHILWTLAYVAMFLVSAILEHLAHWMLDLPVIGATICIIIWTKGRRVQLFAASALLGFFPNPVFSWISNHDISNWWTSDLGLIIKILLYFGMWTVVAFVVARLRTDGRRALSMVPASVANALWLLVYVTTYTLIIVLEYFTFYLAIWPVMAITVLAIMRAKDSQVQFFAVSALLAALSLPTLGLVTTVIPSR